jgi:outer membrane protein TolC
MESANPMATARRLRLLLLLAAILASGCTRAYYRRSADRDTYQAIAQHSNEALWPIANPPVYPPPQSRLFDPFNPDRPPLPPDDPAAYQFLMWPNGIRGSLHYHDNGDAPFIESPSWRDYVTLDANDKLALTPDRAVELGVLNSRSYAFAIDQLYLTALGLTLNRFEFDCHWFLTNNTLWTHFGSSDTEVNTLNSASTFGFTKNLYAGGQLMAEFANNVLITFSGIDQTIAVSNLIATFTQPLLRGAGRWVRLDGLTQAERNTLYAVRDFARFRKRFYVNLTTTQSGGYLGLLLQLQTVRNLESDVKSQEQNYRMHEALYRAQSVSTVQVDQAYTSYLQSRSNLIQAQTSLETSLDSYKINLGLPPDLGVTLDDSKLKPFQLASPELETLQAEVDRFFAGYRERDEPPSAAELRDGFAGLAKFLPRAANLLDQVESELRGWKGQLGQGIDEPGQAQRERETYENLEHQMPELRRELAELTKNVTTDAGKLKATPPKAAWVALQNRSRQLIAHLAQVFVFQTQVRVYLIRLRPVPYRLGEAETYAQANRLDLMNLRGRVVDAWREIGVTANALRSDLNVTASANVATPPLGDRPFDFRASASQYTVGVQFSGPLNREAERNAYRASQIAYQQSRRDFMALSDQINSSIRQDLRTLEQQRINFGIARLALISAARQVEATRERLLLVANASETTSTLDILNALTNLLQAKSGLITSWMNYESGLIQLLFDMDALQLSPRGVPIDESDHDPDTLLAPTPLLPGEPRGNAPRPEERHGEATSE